jgi:hypothetical protein
VALGRRTPTVVHAYTLRAGSRTSNSLLITTCSPPTFGTAAPTSHEYRRGSAPASDTRDPPPWPPTAATCADVTHFRCRRGRQVRRRPQSHSLGHHRAALAADRSNLRSTCRWEKSGF